MLYLATPYTKYPGGVDAAFKDAARLAARLILNGYVVFSPIVHTHPIAVYGEIDHLDHELWMKLDRHMMNACDALVVAMMPGLEESVGVQIEIDYFYAAGKPVHFLECETLELRDVP